MILNSTPGSITWGIDENHCVVFNGEWTLEPKFYLNISTPLFWENTKPRQLLTDLERTQAIDGLLADAVLKKWSIVIT